MNVQKKKQQIKDRRSYRTRSRIRGTKERPRLCVHRTLQHISVQLIDDATGQSLGYADDKDLSGKKSENAAEVGKRIADVAKEKGITTVVFDRGAYKYHGRVKAVAEGAREAGLQI